MTQPVDCDPRVEVDVRGPRFAAAITTVVLAVILLTLDSAVGATLLALQTVVFAMGAFLGLRYQPYGMVFRAVVQPRLAPPSEFEDAAPPRFAGVTVVAYVAVAMALGAAFLNAAFGFCLGCEMYLIGKRILARPVAA